MHLWILVTGAAAIGFMQGFLHCSGMCGPFVLAYTMTLRSKMESSTMISTIFITFVKQHLVHNLGRITSFTLLGAIFGAMGSFINTIGTTTGIEAVAGIVGGGWMLWWALDEFRTGHGGAFIEKWSLLAWPPLQRILRSGLKRTSSGHAYVAGVILGLHPCGLLFALLLTASATGSAFAGGLSLFAFGVGTIPALLALSLAGWYGRKRGKSRAFSLLTAVFMTLSGFLFVLRGFAMNHWISSVNKWLF